MRIKGIKSMAEIIAEKDAEMKSTRNSMAVIIERTKLGMYKLFIEDIILYIEAEDSELCEILKPRLENLLYADSSIIIDGIIRNDVYLRYMLPTLLDFMVEDNKPYEVKRTITVAV